MKNRTLPYSQHYLGLEVESAMEWAYYVPIVLYLLQLKAYLPWKKIAGVALCLFFEQNQMKMESSNSVNKSKGLYLLFFPLKITTYIIICFVLLLVIKKLIKVFFYIIYIIIKSLNWESSSLISTLAIILHISYHIIKQNPPETWLQTVVTFVVYIIQIIRI